MKVSLLGFFIAGSILMASPVVTQASPATGLPAVRHLVYEFGYNTKAAKQGNGTGTITIDIEGTRPRWRHERDGDRLLVEYREPPANIEL